VGVSVTAVEAPSSGLVEKSTTVEVNGKRFDVKVWVPESGGVAPTARRAPRTAAATTSGGGGNVTAPMQGTIVKVLAEVGKTVAAGDAMVVLEAMKMENQLQAEKAGTVKSVNVKAGDKVGAGDVLVVIE
jgi:acetyl-CoA/propionyl-CoA carboxylase biotin carboxyl carrier protein